MPTGALELALWMESDRMGYLLPALTRERFNVELQAIWRETGTSIVLVTHDIPEAVFLADRIVVLAGRPGRVVGDVPDTLVHPRDLLALDAGRASATSREASARTGWKS